jgi:hypothetical protein
LAYRRPYAVTPTVIAHLSPYKTKHINRFDQVLPPITEELRLSPAPSDEAPIR